MLGQVDGVILLVLFVTCRALRISADEKPTYLSTKSIRSLAAFTRSWHSLRSGMVGLVIGGKMVVTNAVIIAKAMGVSEKVIGLTIIAAGTSLPESATSLVAAYRKNADIAVGKHVDQISSA
ncbi:MAG: hypothetical protein MZV63_60905 [Marinilabiliales bacterium]|nr:hypothetical protein [Marinilabiliales bacterium]